MEPAVPPQDLGRLIGGLTERVPGVVRVLVASADGVPVAWNGQQQDPGRLAVLTSGLMGLASGAAKVADGGEFSQALVAMERGTLVVMAIDAGSSLAVLTTADADLDEVAYEMTILAEQAAGLLTPPVRGPGGAGAGSGPGKGDQDPAAGLPGPLPSRAPSAR